MKWLVVVLFATMAGDMYIFTTSSLKTRQECMTTLKTPINNHGIYTKN